MATYPPQLRAIVLASLLAGVGCSQRKTYVTEYGLGPDKWATAWLLTKVRDPNAELVVVPQGTPLPEGTAFDVSSAPVRRIGQRASFEVALEQGPSRHDGEPSERDLRQLADVVHEIEVDFWSPNSTPAATVVEEAFRALQERHGRTAVSPSCYVAFFENVYKLLRDAREHGANPDAKNLSLDCTELDDDQRTGPLVSELVMTNVLDALARGQRVVFVDVREPAEFAEAHIPGAINVSLRDIDQSLVSSLRGADHVISYCVKDFRGFEMAKALAAAGVAHSSILRPYGIKGWVAAGMPTAGDNALPEADALRALATCAAQPANCSSLAKRQGSP